MPSYKVSIKPSMYFCANNVVYSIHASLLLEVHVRRMFAFKSYLNILFLNNYALVYTLGYLL